MCEITLFLSMNPSPFPTNLWSAIHKNKWLFLAIITIAVYFYWSEVRPTLIAKKCHKVTMDLIQEEMEKGGNTRGIDGAYDMAYGWCLHERGIK